MPNFTAQTVARTLIEMWINTCGCPVNLHNDKGTNFMSDIFRELCRILGIEKTSTTSFHPEGKAMIESTNKLLEEGLCKYVDDHQHEWKKYIQLVMMAYRSTVHAVTTYSPFYVVIRTLLRLPIDCLYETRHTEFLLKPCDFIFNTKKELHSAQYLVRAEREEHTRQKTYYDYRAYGLTYTEGKQVVVFSPILKKKRNRKIHLCLQGTLHFCAKLVMIQTFVSIMTEQKNL